MSDIFNISSTAVGAYQQALGTVSNNIANVGTEGYVRQETKLVENTPRNVGTVYIGTGARFAGIQRAYDDFLETNLRNSNSDLSAQDPMVDYANRIVDIMGSDSVGLTPAMDKFFESARALSADPASTILRGQFLRDADGLAGRFRELSTQMENVDTETRESISATLNSINTLSSQLAVVNKQLSREARTDAQPAELLDQRDRLLTDLSKLVKINVTTATNGSVNISIGSNASASRIVDGLVATELGVRFDEADLGRVAIIADPYGLKPEIVAGVTNGKLGGLLSFREQILQPTFSQLDSLAKTIVTDINAIHTGGIDLRGDVGKELFTIEPVTRTDKFSGKIVTLDRASAGMQVAITDATRVAAGSLFRVVENDSNLSGVDATLTYSTNYADPARVQSLSSVLKNNPDPSAGINAPTSQLLGQIPLGSNNWSLFLDSATDQQQLQVFTRDGRQLIGKTISETSDIEALMTTANGFVAGSTYSDTYLNTSGEYGYKQMDVFYGLKAEPGNQYAETTRFSDVHGVLPSLQSNVVETATVVFDGMTTIPKSIAGDTLTINGKVLPALLPKPPSLTIQASDLARWLNKATADMTPAVTASAITSVSMAIDPVDGLYINGIAVPADVTRATAEEVRDYINTIVSDTHVEASVDTDGKLVLTNATGYEGNDMLIGAMDINGDLDGTATLYQGALTLDSEGDITIGYGPAGMEGDLDLLGKPAGTYYTSLLPLTASDAVIYGSVIPGDVDLIAGGALKLNGTLLGSLDLGRTLNAGDIATWLNTAGSELDPAVTVSAATQIKAPASELSLTVGLRINGTQVTGSNTDGSFVDASDMVNQINAASTGTHASLDSSGGVILENATGDDILIAGTGVSARNALGIGNGTYKGSISLSSEAEITLGFADGGTPAELAKLGLRTGVYIQGAVKEDLLVFVTGEGSGTVAGSFDASMADPASLDAARIDSLRAQQFDVTFTSATRYQITWSNPADGTKTVLAERDYDAKTGITYQGLQLKLNNPPASGDKFVIDGNQDGLGNNQTMLDMVALQKKKVIGGANGSTLSEAYEETVGKVGNFSSQASIAQKALEVVNNQAIESRDKVSGVSLDNEAADLIRFQQAYQAAAKAMQVAGELFDSLLQVR
jgi:flagellar hook-associated protein FlgK